MDARTDKAHVDPTLSSMISMANYRANRMVCQAADVAIQVHGGIGYAWETDPHLYYKRLLAAQHLWGGASVWYEELAGLVI